MKYKTIVIDPPWNVKNNLKDLKYYRTGKKMPYEMMSEEEIINFPINDFADKQCDLFLWTITSKIPFCFELLKKWGFRYMDFFAWDKEIGVPVNGIYRRVEWIIYAYRRKMGINKKGKFIPSMFREKRGKHSRKPDIFYSIIKNNTQSPRIDIFSRRKIDGFYSWGNEAPKSKEQPIVPPSNFPSEFSYGKRHNIDLEITQSKIAPSKFEQSSNFSKSLIKFNFLFSKLNNRRIN